MDAKPQRPLRSFKVRDENLLPNALPAKNIHQRNKSSPALSTLASQQAGGWRFGAKRTAFADVSNTTRVNPAIKDDSVITTTKTALASVRETSVQEYTKPAAPLLKPAQRPLSVSGIRGLWNIASNASTNLLKQPSGGARVESDPLIKPRVTKSTAVLRDAEVVPAVTDHDVSLRYQEAKLHVPDVKLLPRQPDRVEPAPATTRPTSFIHPLPTLPTTSSHYGLDIQISSVPEQKSQPAPPTSSGSSEVYVDALSHFVAQPQPTRPNQSQVDAQPLMPKQNVALPTPLSEPAEVWEEEGYEDRYDDEGFTTIRSLKSKGDFTTGQTTIVLAPRMTAKVEKELAAAALFMQASKSGDETEEDELWDTSMVAEYGEDIFTYMRELETRMTPNPYYMDNQTEVQWSMRSVLMDWLIQVHHRFQLLPETLFLCVNYIDRFLSCKVVSINKLQLVGATAILVASKYEEIQCPTVAEIQYMVEGSYTADEILKAERFMLSMLQFELGWPGPMSFLRRISKADDYDLETRTLAKYFLEVMIMDERFVACIPSFTAAGAHCLARLMLNKGTWSQAHVYWSNYTYSQLRPLLAAILTCCDDPMKHHAAVFDKYGDKRFKRASFFVQSELDKGFVLPSIARSSSSFFSDVHPKVDASYA